MGKVLIGNVNPPPEVDQEELNVVINMLDGHIADPTPHVVYDDMQSLTGLFENGIL